MIEKAKSIEEPDRRKHMVAAIANFMKMAYVQWNKDSVSDDTILADLVALSKGELKIEEPISLNKVEYRPPVQTNNNNRGGRTNNQNNRGGSGTGGSGGGGRTSNNNNPRNNNNQNNRGRNPGGSGGGGKKY